MNWYYADKGQQIGPFDDAAFENLVSSGQIQATTLVWNSGMTDWKPVAELGSAPTPLGVGPAAHCSECGGRFAADEMIQFGDVWVCANCKPRFTQKLREGVSLAAGPALRRVLDPRPGGCPRCDSGVDCFLRRGFINSFGQLFSGRSAHRCRVPGGVLLQRLVYFALRGDARQAGAGPRSDHGARRETFVQSIRGPVFCTNAERLDSRDRLHHGRVR